MWQSVIMTLDVYDTPQCYMYTYVYKVSLKYLEQWRSYGLDNQNCDLIFDIHFRPRCVKYTTVMIYKYIYISSDKKFYAADKGRLYVQTKNWPLTSISDLKLETRVLKLVNGTQPSMIYILYTVYIFFCVWKFIKVFSFVKKLCSGQVNVMYMYVHMDGCTYRWKVTVNALWQNNTWNSVKVLNKLKPDSLIFLQCKCTRHKYSDIYIMITDVISQLIV